MKLKSPPLPVLMELLVVAGVAAVVAGVYLLADLAWSLIVGGAIAAAVGLFADVGDPDPVRR